MLGSEADVMGPTRNVHLMQLHVPAVGMRPVLGRPGIVIGTIPLEHGEKQLVIVFDQAQENTGASATNCLTDLMTYCAGQGGHFGNLNSAIWVQRDSEGKYDLVHPTWEGSVCRAVAWSAIKWPFSEPRSEAAFLLVFGDVGDELLQAVRSFIGAGGSERPSAETRPGR